ncbi:MAG: feruloyl-CoA synthase [Spongiibacteraceae bacterium]|nr:feruloyl-CoA synthase [Spongiibacteraceae bacterium]
MTSNTLDNLFLTPDIQITSGDNGVSYLKSTHTIDKKPASLLSYLYHWAEHRPDKTFLAERCTKDPSQWQRISYAEMLKQAKHLAAALDNTPLSVDRPLLILSGNSLANALMMFAAFIKGVPVVPVSPSYSLLSSTFSKIKHIQERVNASVVFAQDYQSFKPVLDHLHQQGLHIISADTNSPVDHCTSLNELLNTAINPNSVSPPATIQPDTVAKILFTSGSTGLPKGVINTHAMLSSNQEAIAKIWPFIEKSDNTLLDWLPWHHTFGGNHNLNMVLRNGCTLYIDAGKPIPGAMQTSIDNLQEISPTLYFNVAAGYELLVTYLEKDALLATKFFKNLHILFFAAAALPETIWSRLQDLVDQTADHPIPITSSWGSTETSPLCTSVHFANTITNNIGVPIPGVELKLAPVGDLTEIRVKGPNVMQTYLGEPEKTAEVFDEEGYFCSGDAVELVDAQQPELGLLFKGRVSENFKLLTGTWVNVSELRLAIVAALSPLASDVVICGHNQHYLSLLIFPNQQECERFIGDSQTNFINHPALKKEIATRLAAHNKKHSGSSKQIKKALLQNQPPSFEENETTDKGYLNQRGILKNRHTQVTRLYSENVDGELIEASDR